MNRTDFRTTATEPLRAIVVPRPGTLELYRAPVSGGSIPAESARPAPGHIRIALHYAGVGFADLLAAADNYPLAPRRPFSPGYEFFGVVEAIGDDPGDTAVVPGDRVCGMLLKMGGYRSRIDVPNELVIPVPSGVSDEAAAALPLNYLTALALLERKAGLSAGANAFIHGAAGGVGTATLECARTLGINVYGTASPEKHEIVRAKGGIPIDYTDGAWLEKALAERPDGYDAVFDSFGGRVQRESWRALRRGGTLVSYGFYDTPNAPLAASVRGMLFLFSRKVLPNGKRARLCGTPAVVRADPGWYRSAMARLLRWCGDRAIEPLVDSIVAWHRVEEAHRAIAERRTRGKVLLSFRE